MGYALFANRKIMLTNRLNCLQLELLDLENQRQNLLDYSSGIADGIITSDEYAGNAGCLSAFNKFYNDAWTNNPNNQTIANNAANAAQTTFLQEHGNASEVTVLTPDEQVAYANLANSAMQSVIQQYAQNVANKEIAAIENRIDMQVKKLETKITATQNELQAVEQAEAKAIQNATPKYAGLG